MMTEFMPINRNLPGRNRTEVKESLLQWESALPREMTSYPEIGSRPSFLANMLHAYYQ